MNAEIQVFDFAVTSWAMYRYGRLEGNLLMFEITKLDWVGSVGFKRLQEVSYLMSQSNQQWLITDVAIPERNGALSIVLVINLKEIPEDVGKFLSLLLGREIRDIRSFDSYRGPTPYLERILTFLDPFWKDMDNLIKAAIEVGWYWKARN